MERNDIGWSVLNNEEIFIVSPTLTATKVKDIQYCYLCRRLLPHLAFCGLCPDCWDEVSSIGAEEHEAWLNSPEGIADSHV